MNRRRMIATMGGGGGDTEAPTLTISALSAAVNVVSMRIVASEAVTGFTVDDITISAGGSLASFATADNITFTVSWTLAAGANTMDIAAGVCTDAAGNDNLAATQYNSGYLTLQAAADAMVLADGTTVNYGAGTTIQAGESREAAGRVRRILIQFDLTSLPSGATVASAAMNLYEVEDLADNARTLKVYRLKRAWVEGTRTGQADVPATGATWERYDTTNNWQTAGGFGADDCEQTAIGSRDFSATETVNEFKVFPLTPTTKTALDLGNGWMIKADTELNDMHAFATRNNATSANRPKLVIVYYVP